MLITSSFSRKLCVSIITDCSGFQNKQRVVKEADQNEIQRIEVKNTAGDEEEGEDKHDVFIHIEALT